VSPVPRNTSGHVTAPTKPPPGRGALAPPLPEHPTLVLYLDTGQVIRFPVITWTLGTGRVSGDLRGMEWTTPPGPGTRAHYVDIDRVIAVVEERPAAGLDQFECVEMQALGPEPDGMIPVKVIRHSQHGVDCSPGCACRQEAP
jgi:hypothetical protein